MRTYILQGHERATIDRTALRLSVAVQPESDDVVLTARCGGQPETRAIRPARNLMILPAVADRTVVVVEPRAGLAGFPPGTVVTLTVQAEPPGGGDTVMVHAVDVSGAVERELAVLGVAGQVVTVSALDAEQDVALPELAAAARREARRRMGRDRVPDGAGVDVVVGVDTTASMLPALADGSVGAALEILAGLWHVVGRDQRFAVCLVGDHLRWLAPDVPVDALAATAVEDVYRNGLGCGFRSAGPQLDLERPARAVTYLVTDGPPADAPALSAAHERSPRHLLMIGSGPSGPVDGVPATWLAPPLDGLTAFEYLTRSRDELGHVVGSLLESSLAAGGIR